MRRLLAQVEADVKDRSYRQSPVGDTVGRFIDSVSYGNAANTALAYARLAVVHDDLAGVHVFCEQPDLLERFLHVHWGGAAETTRAHRWKILNLFFAWCVERNIIDTNPMKGIRKPRNPKPVKERQAYNAEIVRQLIDLQPTLRDRCVLGLLRLALRKNDLRMIQLRDIDLALDIVWLNHAKGGKRHQLPIVFDDLRRDLAAHLAERTLEAPLLSYQDVDDEYLLYPKKHRHRPLNQSSVHRWFKTCLERAGLSTQIEMHEMRHTAGDNIWRQTGNIVLAQKLLRHSSPATTAAYLHPSSDDLREGMKIVQTAWTT
jgi:site-specific recombinase XerC